MHGKHERAVFFPSSLASSSRSHNLKKQRKKKALFFFPAGTLKQRNGQRFQQRTLFSLVSPEQVSISNASKKPTCFSPSRKLRIVLTLVPLLLPSPFLLLINLFNETCVFLLKGIELTCLFVESFFPSLIPFLFFLLPYVSFHSSGLRIFFVFVFATETRPIARSHTNTSVQAPRGKKNERKVTCFFFHSIVLIFSFPHGFSSKGILLFSTKTSKKKNSICFAGGKLLL